MVDEFGGEDERDREAGLGVRGPITSSTITATSRVSMIDHTVVTSPNARWEVRSGSPGPDLAKLAGTSSTGQDRCRTGS